MPPRRKPTSTRQKKADQQLKRAIKRGDVPPPEQSKPTHHRKPRVGPTGRQLNPANATVVDSARKLQSAFIKLPDHYLEQTKLLASNQPLPRPIADSKPVFHDFYSEGQQPLTCPKRPKWRFDMTKTEVEHNEEGLFKKWIAQTDETLQVWQEGALPSELETEISHSPSYYERNLEVWRQLWRVTEISDILLVLLDSRCPPIHYPPSLATHLFDRPVILVLTKVDITGPARVEAWVKYLQEKYPETPIIQVESYIEKVSADQQGRKMYEPSIPHHFRAQLVDVIKQTHSKLLQPPDRIKNNPKALQHWTPRVKREINWEAVLEARGDKVGTSVGGAAMPRPRTPTDPEDDTVEEEKHEEPEFLTVGLIGQPNVGKSSLLNALFGTRRVRASKTPGKTKHFQTLYWTSDVRLVDCPGLVVPNFVPMEMQVLSGILPISRVSAIASCILFAAEVLPLERIYNLVHPSTKSPPAEDKRTWREGMKPETAPQTLTPPSWTAMDILTAYADSKGWVTAKAGRPDVNRAGNAILRALGEGRIGWAFWPPETSTSSMADASGGSQGIWIPRGDSVEDSDISEAEHLGDDDDVDDKDHSDDSARESNDAESDGVAAGGRFAALALSVDDSEDDDSEDSS